MAGDAGPPERDDGKQEDEGGPSAVAHPALSMNEATFASLGCGANEDVLVGPPI